MSCKVRLVTIPVQFIDDFDSLVDSFHILGFLIIWYFYVYISISDEFAPLVKMIQFLINRIHDLLHYDTND